MNFINRKLIISLIFILITTATFAGKPFRIGLKAGFPNVISLNTEFVLPVLNGRIAPTLDYSGFTINIDKIKSKFTYFEAGVNFYIVPKGKWAYANISYISMKTDLSYSDLLSEVNPLLTGGVASTQVKINSLAFKIGAKLGGLFYVRPEIGFLATPLPSTVDVVATFPGSITETQTEEIPKVLSGSFIFNFGFGFAF